MLNQRILGGAIVVIVLLVPLYFGGLFFALLTVALAGVATFELDKLFERLGYRTIYVASVGLSALLVLDSFVRIGLVDWIIILSVLGSLVWLTFRAEDLRTAIVEWALTIVGPFYLGWTLAHFVLLRDLVPNQPWDGLVWAGIALLGTWAADTGAYFAGMRFGRHKLYPRISPGKTWEGLAGGAALAVVVLAVLLFFAPTLGLVTQVATPIPLWVHGIILGLLITGAGLLGDLSESFIKRGTGVKDSSHLIPGHGGLLDRLDSLVFVVPVVYYYVIYLIL